MKTTERVSTRQRVSQNVLKGIALVLAAGFIGAVAYMGLTRIRMVPESAYIPPAPPTTALASAPNLDFARKREKQPYSPTEFFVVFAQDVSNPEAVIREKLASAPKPTRHFSAYAEPAEQLDFGTTPEEHAAYDQALLEAKKSPLAEHAALAAAKPAQPTVKSLTPVFANPQDPTVVKEQFPDRYNRGEKGDVAAMPNWQKITLDKPTDVTELRNYLLTDPRIEQVAFQKMYDLAAAKKPVSADASNQAPQAPTSNDPYLSSSGSWGQPYPDLWGHHANAMNVVGAWAWQTGSPNVVIAVSDSGVDYTHEDIAANIWLNTDEIAENGIDDDNNGYIDDIRGFDFTTCTEADYSTGECATPKPHDADPMDDNGHGTHVAGTIAAVRNNGVGIAGVCPGCKVMPVKGLTAEGWGYSDNLAGTIRYAADNGADVINMSWGGYGSDSLIESALDYAHSLGVTLVAAAGNSDDVADYFTPAGYQNVVTVAATRVNDVRASFSNYGYSVEIAAPGVDILSLRAAGTDLYGDNYQHCVPAGDQNAKYLRATGTSMASPHIAGLVGLLYSGAMNDEGVALDAIYQTAEDANANELPGWDYYLGHGRANAYRALSKGAVIIQGELRYPTEVLTYVQENALVTITGKAKGYIPSFFNHYTVEYARDLRYPLEWHLIRNSTTPVSGDGSDTTLAQWDTTGIQAGQYLIRLTVYGSDGRVLSEVNRILLGVMQGWPVEMQIGEGADRATLADVDASSPGEEVVFTEGPDWGGRFSGLRGDGSRLPAITNFGISTSNNPPAYADIDNDGALEAIFGPNAKNLDGTNVPGFPAALPVEFFGVTGNTVVADVNQDGNQEIVFAFSFGGYYDIGHLFVLNNTGAVIGEAETQYGIWNIALGDLDGNGDLEIVAQDGVGIVYAFHHDGQMVQGWPRFVDDISGHPTTADLDGNGSDEVIVASSEKWAVFIFQGNSEWYGRSPYATYGSPWEILPVDVDQDGVQELVIRSGYYLQILRRSGVALESFPIKPMLQEFSGYWSAAIADVTNDPGLETIWADTFQNIVQATTASGQWASGIFPLSFDAFQSEVPLIGDINGDGQLEYVAKIDWNENYTHRPMFYAFRLNMPVNNAISQWRLPSHDLGLTRRATCPECTADEARPYDNAPLTCDANPATTECDQTASSYHLCATSVCTNTCACTAFWDQVTGWPHQGTLFGHGSLVTADLEGDGSPEILNPTTFNRYVYHADGTTVAGIPPTGEGNEWTSVPSIGNVDADASLEIASTFFRRDYQTYINYFGFTLTDHEGNMLPGWPVTVDIHSENGNVPPDQTIMADVDPVNPGLEVVGIQRGYIGPQNLTIVHVFNDEGAELPGFPVTLNDGTTYGFPHAAGDLDNDGKAEIVVPISDDWDYERRVYVGARMVAIDDNGAVLWEYSTDETLPENYGTPVLGDILPDQPGQEVFFAREARDDTTREFRNTLVLLTGRGEIASGWPASYNHGGAHFLASFAGPMLADMDGDGRLEIAVGVRGSFSYEDPVMFVYEADGSVKQGWPVRHNIFGNQTRSGLYYGECETTATDIDGDGINNIVLCGGEGDSKLTAFTPNGTVLPGWPLVFGGEGITLSPTYADLDGDGSQELIVDQYRVYAYDIPAGSASTPGDWPMGRHDPARSGSTNFVPFTTPPTGGSSPALLKEPTIPGGGG
jgi:subtilisin family serine protease